MSRDIKQVRRIPTQFTTREDGDALTIEGYFAVFNTVYEIAPGMTESVAPGAFDGVLDSDVRALVNHDTTLVLGRTTANTLSLMQDDRGLWGKIAINPNDSDAMNLYERVKRGDVSQCSFGFDIENESAENLDDGSVHWTINKIKTLWEVSCCTFPAYSETHVEARNAEVKEMKKRETEAWRKRMEDKLNGIKSTNAPKED